MLYYKKSKTAYYETESINLNTTAFNGSNFSFFYSLRKNVKIKLEKPTCNCNNVSQSSFHASRIGTTTILNWSAPGGDVVSYYSFGGYFDCDGGFGPFNAYGDAAEISNPHECNQGTISMVTHCSNGCVSSGVILTW